MSDLHKTHDVLCHCHRNNPIRMVVKHRRDTDTYFLSSYPDSPLHDVDCNLFKYRQALLPDVFKPLTHIDFHVNHPAPVRRTPVKGTSTRDAHSEVRIKPPSMMESLLITLVYNSFSHFHFGHFVTLKEFTSKLRDNPNNSRITFPNRQSLNQGLFYGKNGLTLAKIHAKTHGCALWMRLASDIRRSEHGLMVNEQRLACEHVEWPHKTDTKSHLLFCLLDAKGAINVALIYPVCDHNRVLPFQREKQRVLIEHLSGSIYGLNRQKHYRYYMSVPLHSTMVDDTPVTADMLVVRKDKKTGEQLRFIIGTMEASKMQDAYDALPLNTVDILNENISLANLMRNQ